MIESVKIQQSGDCLAVILKNYLLAKAELELGDSVEVFVNPVDNSKRLFSDVDVFHVKLKSVSQSTGFYFPKSVSKHLGLKPKMIVEIVYSKVVLE